MLQTVRRQNLGVPRSVSLVDIGSVPATQFAFPPLSAIHVRSRVVKDRNIGLICRGTHSNHTLPLLIFIPDGLGLHNAAHWVPLRAIQRSFLPSDTTICFHSPIGMGTFAYCFLMGVLLGSPTVARAAVAVGNSSFSLPKNPVGH